MFPPFHRYCPLLLLIVLIGAGLRADPVFAQDGRSGEAGSPATDVERRYYVDAVLIDGLNLTERFVVERELLFDAGERVPKSRIEESIQRIRNTGLFRVVEYELLDRTVPLPEETAEKTDHRILQITVDERWTLLPTFGFNFGGGLFSLSFGLWDINFLGRYLEIGGQYQRLGETNSFTGWFANPRTFDLRLSTGVELQWTNRVRILYDDQGEIEGGYLRFRRKLSLFANREWFWWLRTGMTVSFSDDEFGIELVPESALEAQRARGLPEPVLDLPVALSVSLGRIDEFNYRRDGVRLYQRIGHSNSAWGSSLDYTSYVAEATYFQLLPFTSNLGLRAGFGTTSADQLEQQYFLGGFGTLRGFVDSRFRGPNFWYSNAELRVPSLDTRWVVLQHIGFVDAGGVSDSLSQIAVLSGASAGVGLRLILPKISAFVARIDLAFPFHGTGVSNLSFGAQQFF